MGLERPVYFDVQQVKLTPYSNGRFNLYFPWSMPYSVQVIDSRGATTTIHSGQGPEVHSLDFSQQPTGLKVIEIRMGNQRIHKKMESSKKFKKNITFEIIAKKNRNLIKISENGEKNECM